VTRRWGTGLEYRHGLVGAALVVLTVAVTGCTGSPPPEPAAPHAAASTRPATKATCPDVQWDPPPSVPLERTSRDLVPFSPTLLGVDTTWRGDDFTVETVSGGYVDELTEPYDDLRPAGTRSLHGDTDAQVMHGSFQGSPVLLVVWRDSSQAVPCDVHALLVQGADAATEDLLLQGLR
jgi:hypothetical protein